MSGCREVAADSFLPVLVSRDCIQTRGNSVVADQVQFITSDQGRWIQGCGFLHVPGEVRFSDITRTIDSYCIEFRPIIARTDKHESFTNHWPKNVGITVKSKPPVFITILWIEGYDAVGTNTQQLRRSIPVNQQRSRIGHRHVGFAGESASPMCSRFFFQRISPVVLSSATTN